MYNFVVKVRPKSYNSWKGGSATSKANYKRHLEEAFKEKYQVEGCQEGDLYGLVYHFYQSQTDFIDADNLSKPIWDCLQGVLFFDDRQVKMRIAGSFDLENSDLAVIDFSGLSEHTAAALLKAFETEEHVLYVECGAFTVNMIRLNLNRDEY